MTNQLHPKQELLHLARPAVNELEKGVLPCAFQYQTGNRVQ